MPQDLEYWTLRVRRALESGTPIRRFRGEVGGNRIPAAALRANLVASDLAADPRGLQIDGAIIYDDLNLTGMGIEYPLSFLNCRFEEPVIFRTASFASLNLAMSSLPGLDFQGAQVRDDFLAYELRCLGELDAAGARIGGQLTLVGSSLWNSGGTALRLDGSSVQGGLYLDRSSVHGSIQARSAQFNTQVSLSDIRIGHPTGTALGLDGMRTDGSFFIENAIISGTIATNRLQVAGALYFANTVIDSAGEPALVLRLADIGGDLDLEDMRVNGTIVADGMKVENDLRLQRAHIRALRGSAVMLDRAQVGGHLLMSGTRLEGALRIVGASIGGDLRLNRATVHNPFATAILADDIYVGSDLTMDRAECIGEIRIISGRIGGDLYARDASFQKVDGVALGLDGSTIGGHVVVSRSSVTGEFRACGAFFEGQFSFEDVDISNRSGDALALEGTEIRRQLLLQDVRTVGPLNMTDIKITGRLIISPGRESTPSEQHLTLLSADLQWLEVRPVATQLVSLDLRGAHVSRWSVPRIEGLKLAAAAGWSIDLVDGVALTQKGAESLLNSLDNDGGNSFVEQTWTAFASAIHNSGYPDVARRVRSTGAWRVTRFSRGSARTAGTAYGLLVGHGYRPALIVLWMIGLFVLALALATLFSSHFVPSDWRYLNALLTPDLSSLPPAGYPGFDPLLYAIDSSVPAANTGQSTAWRVSDDQPVLSLAFAAIKGLAWIFAALLLAGVTGILRRT